MKVLADPYSLKISVWNLESYFNNVSHYSNCTITKRQWLFCQCDFICSANTSCYL